MMPPQHTVISAGLAVAVGTIFKSWPAATVCFISGIFIDIDHHLDYIFANKKFPWSYKELIRYCGTCKAGKLYLIFHSYELLVVLWVIFVTFQLNIIWLGFLIGITAHILCDQLVNPLRPWAYFMTYRALVKFERNKIYSEKYIANYAHEI